MPTTSRLSHLASIPTPTPVPLFYWRVESKKSNCICIPNKNPQNTRLFRPPDLRVPLAPCARCRQRQHTTPRRPRPSGRPRPGLPQAEGTPLRRWVPLKRSHIPGWSPAASQPAAFFYSPGSPKLSPFLSDHWRSNWPLFPPSLGDDPHIPRGPDPGAGKSPVLEADGRPVGLRCRGAQVPPPLPRRSKRGQICPVRCGWFVKFRIFVMTLCEKIFMKILCTHKNR